MSARLTSLQVRDDLLVRLIHSLCMLVITVFSAPNYCDRYANKGAILRIGDLLLIALMSHIIASLSLSLSLSVCLSLCLSLDRH
jgi:hypothetical protein